MPIKIKGFTIHIEDTTGAAGSIVVAAKGIMDAIHDVEQSDTIEVMGGLEAMELLDPDRRN